MCKIKNGYSDATEVGYQGCHFSLSARERLHKKSLLQHQRTRKATQKKSRKRAPQCDQVNEMFRANRVLYRVRCSAHKTKPLASPLHLIFDEMRTHQGPQGE